MASLGSSEFWLRDIAGRGTKTRYLGPLLGVFESAPMTTSHLYQFVSCSQSWWECRSGWSWLFCDHREQLVYTSRHSNDVFYKTPKQSIEKWAFRHSWGWLSLCGTSQVAWLTVHELLNLWDGQGLVFSRGRPYGEQKGRMPSWATG